MATDIRTKYPASSTSAITCTFASLASDANLLAGRESSAIDNTTNQDLDHLVSGAIRTGTSPTAGKQIEVWAYSLVSQASGTPNFPDVISGTNNPQTLTSDNVKFSALRHVATMTVDATSSRVYSIPPTSIANLFGGSLPPFWGLFVTHNTVASLSASQLDLQYTRIQGQTV